MSDTTVRRGFNRREGLRALLTFLFFALIAFLGPFLWLRLREEPPPAGAPAGEAAARGTAPVPGGTGPFPGMVEIPAGPFTMGVDESWLVAQFRPGTDRSKWHPALTGDGGAFLWWNLLLETPAHEERTDRSFIDRYRVTNAQYERFLLDTASVTLFVDEEHRTLAGLGRKLLGDGVPPDELRTLYRLNADKLDRLKARIHEENTLAVRDAVLAFNEGRPAGAGAPDFDSLPERERIDAWLGFRLPVDTAVAAFSRRIPSHWPGGRVTPEIADLPVVDVTPLDADDFAAWAGKHVVTEFEYEKAARAPDGRLWPWGNTFDLVRDRNVLNWLETEVPPRGPAAPMKDRPIAVDAIPAGAAPCGCFQMLGNVYEITSTSPWLYPSSRAEAKPWFGDPRYRVLRGGASYGQGITGRVGGTKRELLIRSTSRFVAAGPDQEITDTFHALAIGFRCAKDPVPARDVVGHRLREARGDARFPDLDLAPGFGVEANAYAAPGAEGPGLTYVLGPTRAVGVAPVAGLPFDDADSLAAAAADPAEPVILAFLAATPGLRIEGAPEGDAGRLFVGWSEGRARLLAKKVLGFERLAPLDEAPVAEVAPDAAGAAPEAKVDAATGTVSFRLPFATASSDRVLVFSFALRVKGDLSGTWRGVSE